MKTFAFRLHPGQDLKKEIFKFTKQNKISAGAILTCVGSLQKIIIRMAGAKEIKTFEEDFEIVSLAGTLEENDGHLHISISDKDGNVFGGHLKDGAIIRTTAEIVIAELDGLSFGREFDKETGYEELVIKNV
ncbi:MAG: DNA-binding protein [bacterium]|nr:DNA-binding protein [bacterium]